jgi:YVTN family beta-propeller protein
VTQPQQVGAPLRTPLEQPSPSVHTDGQAWLRQLDWRQFEELVASAYRLQGFTVLPTSPGADGGIDLILIRGNERIFVQCKHWKAWQVGAPIIRELFGLVAAHQATRGIVVTSGTFSREAQEFARHTGTELLDGPAVLALVASGNAHRPVSTGQPFPGAVPPPPTMSVPPASQMTGTPGSPACPVCLSAMVLQKARRGARAGSLFWGCSRYPGCRGTLEAPPGTRLPPTPRQLARQNRDRRKAIFALVAVLLGTAVLMIMFGSILVRGAARPTASSPARFVPSAPAASPAGSASTSSRVMGEQPMDIVVDAAGARLYTANYVSGDVTVIDAQTMAVVDTIGLPGKPSAITISGATLYVADSASRKVYAISLRSHRTTATFATGLGPVDLAIDPKVGRLFIANSESDNIRAYALDSGRRLGTISASGVASIAVDTAEHKLYSVASVGVLVSYHTRTLERADTTYAGNITGLAMDSRRQRLYTVNSAGLNERNLLTGASRTIAIDIRARAVTVDPSRQIAYVVDPDTGAVQAVSLR